MNNIKNNNQEQINQQEPQQQKTRQQQEPKRQGQNPKSLHADLKYKVQDHERPELRMSR